MADKNNDQSDKSVEGQYSGVGEEAANDHAGDKIAGDKIQQQINTEGGAVYQGPVTAGGDVIAGDKVTVYVGQPEKAPKPFNPKIEPELVSIPTGEFTMGDETGGSASTSESLSTELDLPDYWISKSTVSVKEFEAFLQGVEELPGFLGEVGDEMAAPSDWSGRSISPPGWSDGAPPTGSTETEAVQGVTWFEAVAYCEWLTRETGREYTLPTEAQWEKAAKQEGDDKMQWGRVREWTRSLWGVSRAEPDEKFDYPYEKDDRARNRVDAGHYLYRVYRGKGYGDDEETSATTRGGFLPTYRGPFNNLHGFRVVLEHNPDAG